MTSSQVVATSEPEQENVLEQLAFHLSQVDINDELTFLELEFD